MTGTVGIHQPRHAQHRVTPKHGRVQKIIVHPAVNDVDGPQPLGRAHEDPRIAHQQVAALDNFDAHLPRQIGVFEVSASCTRPA